MKTDESLVIEFCAGQHHAFDELVDRHYRPTFRLIVALIGHAQDAEELAQDVFVKVYRKLGQFKGQSMFKTWLYVIIQNTVRSYRIRSKFKSWLSLDLLMESTPFEIEDTSFSPDTTVEEKERLSQLNHALEQLPFKWREILVLREYQELSYEEIAQTLQCSIGTVKSRLARAKEKLRRSWDEHAQTVE